MANIGIPEIMVIAVIVMALLGTPALLVIIFFALRRAAGAGSPPTPPAAPGASLPPAGPVLRAAGQVRADGSLQFGDAGLRARRVAQGVYQIVFDGLDLTRHYAVHATALTDRPGEAPAVIELLAGEARARYIAAGADEQALLVWVRLPDLQPADRDFMLQIVEVA